MMRSESSLLFDSEIESFTLESYLLKFSLLFVQRSAETYLK